MNVLKKVYTAILLLLSPAIASALFYALAVEGVGIIALGKHCTRRAIQIIPKLPSGIHMITKKTYEESSSFVSFLASLTIIIVGSPFIMTLLLLDDE